jgi:hypothetical protein
MIEPPFRRVSAWPLRLLCLPAVLTLGGCFPNADELQLPGGAGGTGAGGVGAGGTITANGGAGGPQTDGPIVTTDGPNPGMSDAAAHDGVVIPTVEGSTCADFAAVWCARAQECEPRSLAFMVAGLDCSTRLTTWCQAFLQTPTDTNWTPDAFRGCVGSLAKISCEDWLSTNEYLKGQLCLIAGKRKAGQGCSSWSQCESVRCDTWGDCGVCRPRSLVEGSCQGDADCVPGLMCSPNHKCKVPLGIGGRCSAETPCHPTLRCTDSGVCARLAKKGEACRRHVDCDRESFLLCNSTTHNCGPAVAAAMWSNDNTDGSVSYCANNASAIGAMGECSPRVQDDGGGCVSQTEGMRCIFPALCSIPAGETTGMCEVPKFLDCPAVRPDPPAGGYKPGEDPWCPNVEFPLFCTGNDADVGPNCWSERAICSTVVNCAGDLSACVDAGSSYDCQTQKCAPACTPPAGGTPCDKCISRKCCQTKAACDADPMCTAGKTGASWTELQTCRTTFCPVACQ